MIICVILCGAELHAMILSILFVLYRTVIQVMFRCRFACVCVDRFSLCFNWREVLWKNMKKENWSEMNWIIAFSVFEFSSYILLCFHVTAAKFNPKVKLFASAIISMLLPADVLNRWLGGIFYAFVLLLYVPEFLNFYAMLQTALCMVH